MNLAAKVSVDGGSLEESVCWLITEKMQSYLEELTEKLGETKSPIERLFYVEFQNFTKSPLSCDNGVSPDCRLDYVVTPQSNVSFRGKKYVVDFEIMAVDYNTETNWSFVIECDGFEYHSSKEQMSKDYERERALQEKGYTVIRFTGSEINENPEKCVNTTIRIIESQIKDYYFKRGLPLYG